MKTTDPKLDDRREQPTIGIRSQVTVDQLGPTIRELIDAVYAWLGQHGIEGVGAPYNRFYVIDMPGRLDVEIGVPVAISVEGSGRVQASTLPAGRYASLIYTGIENGIPGNKALLDWGAAQGLQWDRWDTPLGDAFGGRYETFLSGPQDDPDPANWDTEVAIKLADV